MSENKVVTRAQLRVASVVETVGDLRDLLDQLEVFGCSNSERVVIVENKVVSVVTNELTPELIMCECKNRNGEYVKDALVSLHDCMAK